MKKLILFFLLLFGTSLTEAQICFKNKLNPSETAPISSTEYVRSAVFGDMNADSKNRYGLHIQPTLSNFLFSNLIRRI